MHPKASRGLCRRGERTCRCLRYAHLFQSCTGNDVHAQVCKLRQTLVVITDANEHHIFITNVGAEISEVDEARIASPRDNREIFTRGGANRRGILRMPKVGVVSL